MNPHALLHFTLQSHFNQVDSRMNLASWVIVEFVSLDGRKSPSA